MKSLFIFILMTCFVSSVTFAAGQNDDTICAAMAESNTRSVKSVASTATELPTKTGATAQ
jgi:hypothetical protein